MFAAFDAELAKILGFGQLAELAAGQAQVIVIVAVVWVQGLAVSHFLLFFFFLYDLKTSQVGCFLTFQLCGCSFLLCAFAGLLDEGHEVFVIVPNDVNF